ncbi:MAG: type II secretion system protein GspE [Candidatus Neomarinimicrobiota bacterium]|nr:MAG: type II secretion system protein GspE [Candidatus Neomarinimicrobiota bacterium]
MQVNQEISNQVQIQQRIQSFVLMNRIPRVDLQNIGFIDPGVVDLIPEETARQFNVLAYGQKNGNLLVAMANPFDLLAKTTIRQKTGLNIEVGYVPRDVILSEIDKYYSQKANLEESMKELVNFEVEEEEEDDDEEQLRIQAEDAPAIKFVNLLLLQATQDRASDVHIEPQEKEIKVRLRIDGILREIPPPPKRMQSGIISRIKILGGLDIAERRIPQDGRTKIKILGRQIDIRISTLPTIYGEKVVMRILDKGSVSLNINDVGFEPRLMNKFKEVLTQAHGMILVTGPTGSGKTTTLYSALNFVNSPEKNIITVEDPVEYRLKGINQIQARPQVGLTFAAGLRSILRQDPDIVMVGEIRDRETAEIAIKAALTGHLVLSTLHTNDAIATIIRLINMGVDKYLICSALSLVIAQRLARRICLHCKTSYTPDEEVLLRLQALNIDPSDITFYKGTGCDHCGGTGYWGRLAVYEFFLLYPEIKEMVIENASEEALRKKGQEIGMESLLENGIKKVREGLTTVDEILRII